MKKTCMYGLILIGVSLTLAGCAIAQEGDGTSGKKPGEKTEITVFAAASLTETLEEIEKAYEEENPQVDIILNLDSSGTLKTQIEEGADCDIFISAAQKQMDELDIEAGHEKNPERLDFVDHDSRIDILENRVVLAVPDTDPKKVTSFEDMAQGLRSKDLLLAMGNDDVPVGRYTKEILDYYGLNEDILAFDGLITYGSNVKEVTTQVKEGAADCGVIYSTDAYSAGLKTVDTADEKMCSRVIYPAAVLKKSKEKDAAEKFLNSLSSEESRKIFESVGFKTLSGK